MNRGDEMASFCWNQRSGLANYTGCNAICYICQWNMEARYCGSWTFSQFPPKCEFCYHLLTLIKLFQTCITFFLLWNTKGVFEKDNLLKYETAFCGPLDMDSFQHDIESHNWYAKQPFQQNSCFCIQFCSVCYEILASGGWRKTRIVRMRIDVPNSFLSACHQSCCFSAA